MLVRAREVVRAAKANGTNLYTMNPQDFRAHLLNIFNANRLGEVQEMWGPVSGYVNFNIMYHCPDGASDEHKALMGRWRA